MVTTGTEVGRVHEASVRQTMNKNVTMRKVGCDIGTWKFLLLGEWLDPDVYQHKRKSTRIGSIGVKVSLGGD
jgi:hypothetical protein